MTKLEQMKEQKFYQYLQVAGFHKEAEQFITEVWNEAIKECEGCVPEEKDHMLVEIDADYFRVEGHNSCREQTLQAISKLRV